MIQLLILIVLVAAVVAVVRSQQDKKNPFSAPSGLSAVLSDERQPEANQGLKAKLDTWVAAGLIGDDQADAIVVYEADHVPAPASRVPMAAEAIGYIGGALLVAAVALLIGNRWEDISTPTRIAVLTLATLMTAVAGWWTGRDDEPALQRLGSVLWLLAVAATAGLAAEIWIDAIHDNDPPGHGGALFVGGIALVAASATWLARPEPLQHVALFGGAITTSIGVLEVLVEAGDSQLSATNVGLLLLALGGAWFAGGITGVLPPAVLAELAGGGLALVGAQTLRDSNDDLGLWLGLAVAVALLAAGVARSNVLVLLVGTAGVFQWTPQIALFYLEDTLGTEATLAVIGALLIGVAGSMTRVYPMVKARRSQRLAT